MYTQRLLFVSTGTVALKRWYVGFSPSSTELPNIIKYEEGRIVGTSAHNKYKFQQI